MALTSDVTVGMEIDLFDLMFLLESTHNRYTQLNRNI